MIALCHIWSKLSIIYFKQSIFESVAAFLHFDAADGDDEAAIFLLEGSGVQETQVLGAAELPEQGEVVFCHVSGEIGCDATVFWEVYLGVWLLDVEDLWLHFTPERVYHFLVAGVGILH